MSFKLGGMSGDSALPPNNQGLPQVSQAILDNVVSRAVARHTAALSVNANYLTMWLKSYTGTACTCTHNARDAETTLDDIVQGNFENAAVPSAADNEFRPVQVRVIKAKIEPDDGWNIDFGYDKKTDPTNLHAHADDDMDEAFNETTADELATQILGENYVMSAADNVACGICFGTGRTQGYALVGGRRIILDATNEIPYQLINNAEIKQTTHPYSFHCMAESYVQWQVELPVYVDKWLDVVVRNNLLPVEYSNVEYMDPANPQSTWQLLTPPVLVATNGTDRNWLIRVIPNNDFTGDDRIIFTHVEICYQSNIQILGSCGQLEESFAPDQYDMPIITTEFEINGVIPYLPVETVFLDSQYRKLWKVTSSTRKTTARNQVYGYTVQVREVQQREMLYALRTVINSLTYVAYRGVLEQVEGGISTEETDEAIEGAWLNNDQPPTYQE